MSRRSCLVSTSAFRRSESAYSRAYVCVTLNQGGYTVLFAICLWQLLQPRKLNRTLLFVAILQYTLSLSYIILDFRRIATSYTPNTLDPLIAVYQSHRLGRLAEAAAWIARLGVSLMSDLGAKPRSILVAIVLLDAYSSISIIPPSEGLAGRRRSRESCHAP